MHVTLFGSRVFEDVIKLGVSIGDPSGSRVVLTRGGGGRTDSQQQEDDPGTWWQRWSDAALNQVTPGAGRSW